MLVRPAASQTRMPEGVKRSVQRRQDATQARGVDPLVANGPLFHFVSVRNFKSFTSAERFCRSYDELRNFLRPRTRHNRSVSTNR
jgi:hypothetical protein